jgi:hypothetical protein
MSFMHVVPQLICKVFYYYDLLNTFGIPLFLENASKFNPKKEAGKFRCYLRFLSAQKATIPMTVATATAMIMTALVVMSGASVMGSDGSDSVGSGSIGCAGDGASSTPIAISIYAP